MKVVEPERPLPTELEAEQMILGVVLLNNSVLDQALEILGQGNAEKARARFFNWSNRCIFAAMARMFIEGEAIDPVTLQSRLQHAEVLEKVGGPAYISSLFDGVPKFSNIENYCNLVLEAAIRREQIAIGNWLMNSAWAPDAQSDEITAQLNQKLDSLVSNRIRHELVSASTAATRVLERLERKWEDPSQVLGLKTGYDKLDQTIYGLRKSRFYIIASPAKVGKTTLGLNLVHNVIDENLVEGSAPVALVLSLEMSADELSERGMAAFATVSLKSMLTGTLTEAEKVKVRQAKEKICQMPIEYLESMESITPATIKALVKKVKRSHGRLDLLVVDYIQLCDDDAQTENDTARVSRVTRQLKKVAMGFELPVIGLSQVNRNYASRTDPKLRLPDLRQSGSLEQDADCVMFIQRENPHDLSDNRRVLEIAAQRGGESGVEIPMMFFGERSRFELADIEAYRAVEPISVNGNGKGRGRAKKSNLAPVEAQERASGNPYLADLEAYYAEEAQRGGHPDDYDY